MPFGRFFGSKPKEPSPPTDAAGESNDDAIDGADDEPTEIESIPAEHDEADWLSRARAVLPTGSSTGSKRIEALYGAPDAVGPTHFQQAVGQCALAVVNVGDDRDVADVRKVHISRRVSL